MNVGWRATFVYREPRVQDRHLMRSLLRRIKPMRNAPWIMIGDFNEVLWGFEHFSTHKRAESQMAKFRDVLTHCNLHDVGFLGLPWTYDNKQRRNKNVRVRLDCAITCPSWSQLFTGARMQHIISSWSDHSPIMLEVEKEREVRPSQQIFRYEIMWECEHSLSEEVQRAWGAGTPV
jgi:endonuclease/exonuclease/phosphatase family metal-dependent hydrolase